MGIDVEQIYKAPDGTLYSVEPDGSVRKINGPDSNNNRQKNSGEIIIIILVLLALIASASYYFIWYRPQEIERNLIRKYPIVNLFLRTSKTTDTKANIIDVVRFGSELKVYDIDDEWATVKYISPISNESKNGFVASAYLIDNRDYNILAGIIPDEDVKEEIASSRVRRALLDYFNKNQYVGNMTSEQIQEFGINCTTDNQWQVVFHHGQTKPNEILFVRNVNPDSKYPDIAILIENLNTRERKIVYYTFDDDETPVFVFDADAPAFGYIVSIEKSDIKDYYGRIVEDIWNIKFTTCIVTVKINKGPERYKQDNIEYPKENIRYWDGKFYGNIGGYGIHGLWNTGSQVGGGYIYYDSQGPDSILEYDFINNEDIWYEYTYVNGVRTPTGEWHLNYFDTSEICFAKGTYIRESDKKNFSFELYKDY